MSELLHIADATVGELMTRPVVSVRPDTTVMALAGLMEAHPFNGLPVVDESGVVQGVVTRGDLKRHLAPYCRFMAALEDSWTESAAAIMTRHPIVLYPFEPAVKAIHLVGVVTRGDLTRSLSD